MEWQLIETAPKDGTRILVYDGPPDSMGPGIYIAKWVKVSDQFSAWEADTRETDPWDIDPIWWMPLPFAPPGGDEYGEMSLFSQVRSLSIFLQRSYIQVVIEALSDVLRKYGSDPKLSEYEQKASSTQE